MSDSGAWLEHQLYEMKIMGVNLSGWSSLCMQWTWLCLLAGGLGAFLSYWYRLDTFYIVLYGGGSVLMAMITMLFDNGTAEVERAAQASLQDYLENVLYPRMRGAWQEKEAGAIKVCRSVPDCVESEP